MRKFYSVIGIVLFILSHISLQAQCNCSQQSATVRSCNVEQVSRNNYSNVFFKVVRFDNPTEFNLIAVVLFTSNPKYLNGRLDLQLKDGTLLSLAQKTTGTIVNSDRGKRVETAFRITASDIEKLTKSTIASFQLRYSSDNGARTEYYVNQNADVIWQQLYCLTR